MPSIKSRRSSNVSWTKVSKLSLRPAKRKQSVTSLSPAVTIEDIRAPSPIFDLPSEVLVNIIAFLESKDVLSLRSTSRALDHFITCDGSEVARWLARYGSPHIPRTLEYTISDGRYWRRVLQQTRRWAMVSGLVDVSIEFIQYRTLLNHNAQRALRFEWVAESIRLRLVPLLFPISVYIDLMKTLILDLSQQSDMAPDTLHASITTHTRALLSGIPRADLRSLHYAWLYLLWLLKTILARPSYAGTIERTVRGWTADELDKGTLARMLVFGNLRAVTALFRQRDYKNRRNWARQFLKSLDPSETIAWPGRWADLGVGLNAPLSDPMARKMSVVELDMQSLWLEGALQVFEEMGEEALDANEKAPSANNTVRLLSDLVGIDLFHGFTGFDQEDSRDWRRIV